MDFGLRWYEPRLGRFLNRDPLGQAGGTNLYAYLGGCVFGSWDAWGLTEARDYSGNDDVIDLEPFYVETFDLPPVVGPDFGDDFLAEDLLDIEFDAAADVDRILGDFCNEVKDTVAKVLNGMQSGLLARGVRQGRPARDKESDSRALDAREIREIGSQLSEINSAGGALGQAIVASFATGLGSNSRFYFGEPGGGSVGDRRALSYGIPPPTGPEVPENPAIVLAHEIAHFSGIQSEYWAVVLVENPMRDVFGEASRETYSTVTLSDRLLSELAGAPIKDESSTRTPEDFVRAAEMGPAKFASRIGAPQKCFE